MSDIIKIKPQWEHNYKRHLFKVDEIQGVVQRMMSEGLKVRLDDIRNLINHGTGLYVQAEQAAKSNAGIFTLPAAKQKFIEENTKHLQSIISQAKGELAGILALDGINPLSIEAYEITEGVVSISDTWLENLKEQHTIRTSDNREKALVLMNAVKEATNQLNDFVKENKHFGAGVTLGDDSRRSLVSISDDGEINLEIDNLEFV